MIESKDFDVSFARIFSGIPSISSVEFDLLSKLFDDFTPIFLSNMPVLAAEIAGNEGLACLIEFLGGHGGTRLYISNDLENLKKKLK